MWKTVSDQLSSMEQVSMNGISKKLCIISDNLQKSSLNIQIIMFLQVAVFVLGAAELDRVTTFTDLSVQWFF